MYMYIYTNIYCECTQVNWNKLKSDETMKVNNIYNG